MDKDTKALLEEIRIQQANILRNQKSLLNRLEVVERIVGVTPKTAPVQKQQTDKKPIEQVKAASSTKSPTQPSPAQRIDSILSGVKAKNKGDKAREDLEFQIGGTWLNRLGAVAVILGLSFFLKYSFDNQWIGPTGRVIMGIMAGLAFLIVGEKLRKKYFLYSQGLIGAGSLALYFSVYAAYNFYDLIPPYMAFIFLIIVMANTVFTSVRHNSLTIGILGIIGGYGAPLLISTGSPLPWVFFGYLAILTCGILGVSVYKRWDYFRLISFAFNQLLIAFWYFTVYNEQHIIPSFIFVVFNFVSYLVIATGFNIKVKSVINEAETVLIALNALGFFAWSKLMLEDTFINDYMGFYALAIALVYIFIGRLAHRLNSNDKKQVYTLFAVAVQLITLAIFLQLDYEYVAYGWILEAFGIFYIASQLKNRLLLIAGLIVLGLGTFAVPTWVNKDYIAVSWLGEALGLFLMGIKLDIIETRFSAVAALALGSVVAVGNALSWKLFGSHDFLLNWQTLILVLAIIMSGLVYFLYRQLEKIDNEEKIQLGVGTGALLLIFAFLTIENHHFFLIHEFKFFLSPEQLSLSLLWMTYAIALFVAGLKRDIRGLRYGALGLIGIIILKAFFVDLAELAMVFKILLFIILGLFLLGVSFVYQKKRSLFDRSDSM